MAKEINIGGTTVSKVYLGSTEIQKVYLGSTLVWEKPDVEAPTAPTSLVASVISNIGFTLSWTASTDNVAVTGYKIYKGGVLYQDVGLVLTKAITGQTASSSATWTVKAYDAATNLSAASSGKVVVQSPSVTAFNITTIGQADAGSACGVPGHETKYKTGDVDDQYDGDVWYEESTAITLMDGNDDWWSATSNGGSGDKSFQVDSVGTTTNTADC
jgi:hypothetical protein